MQGWPPPVLAVALTAALASSCGGRTQLIPAYQIGRLSDDAVIARDGDVRVVVRTDAWAGQALDVWQLFPVELTFENGSTRALRIRRDAVALVTPDGQRIEPFDVAELSVANPAINDLATHALDNRVVAPGERVSGFLYFPAPAEEDQLQLRIALIDAADGNGFGLIEIPFHVD